MAKVTIEDAQVQRVFSTEHGWGVSVFETYTPKGGEERKDYFTLWFKDRPDVDAGDVVSASGFLSKRARKVERDGEEPFWVADVSVRGARLISHVQAPKADPEPWEQPGERF
jgi:hypothetical protein